MQLSHQLSYYLFILAEVAISEGKKKRGGLNREREKKQTRNRFPPQEQASSQPASSPGPEGG